MSDRPICKQCEHFRLWKARGVCGWDAVCAFHTKRGRKIDWQYGLSFAWTKAELKDRLESRICPAWCPKWRKDSKNEQAD